VTKGDEQINHHIHFKIVHNNKLYIFVFKSNVDPEDCCLNGKNYEFLKQGKDKNSLNGTLRARIVRIVNSIDEAIRNNSYYYKFW